MIMFYALNEPHLPITPDTPIAHIDDTTTPGATYICWEDPDSTNVQHIEKVTDTGVGFAKGKFSDRATLTYVPYHEYRP